jgi:acetyltransferase-like isoleucine patch superfamily enzyme
MLTKEKYIYKGIIKIENLIYQFYSQTITLIIFHSNSVIHHSFHTNGIPYLMVARGAIGMSIGENFSMNNGIKGNPIGCYQKCTFFVDRDVSLTIGDNVGISQTALIAHANIEIQNNVKIGGGVCIYTTDFHSLDPIIRIDPIKDMKYKVRKPVLIKENAFIGAHSIILKGVTIGKNSVVGAGSVVTKSIPDNQIWAGNPARFIRNIEI